MKKIIPSILIVAVLLFLYFISRTIPQQDVQNLISNAGMLGPIVFILLTLVTYIVAPLSGTPLLFIGYYLYGEKVIFLNTVSALFSFIVNFWIARKLGRDFVKKIIGETGIKHIDTLTHKYGVITLFFLRIFQGSVHDFVSLAAGLTSMPFRTYIVVSIIAIVPGTFLWYALSKLVNTPAEFTLLSVAFTTTFSLGFIAIQTIINRIKKSHV